MLGAYCVEIPPISVPDCPFLLYPQSIVTISPPVLTPLFQYRRFFADICLEAWQGRDNFS